MTRETKAPPLPHVRRHAGSAQLVIDGVPALLLGGQLYNSTASSTSHVRRAFDHLAGLNVGVVLGSASWELIEPEEGAFDFTQVDVQVAAARDHGMRLVLIWFGAFKNAASTYAPRWVRADTARFPRAQVVASGPEAFSYAGAMPKPILSVFAPELLAADRAAFRALMSHLASADPEHVVVMVQVENEVGLLRDSRDRSQGARDAWGQPVPRQLLHYLEAHDGELRPELAALWHGHGRAGTGSWEEVFGATWEAEEVFMAWAFATYVEAVAAAGKAVKSLPMYVNGWLGPQPGQDRAGQYPSGGPASRVLDVWKAAAPSIDLLAPDIYIPSDKAVMAAYARGDNPLFIPESRLRAGSLFWALGQHHALGFSAFGIEDCRPGSQVAVAFKLVASMTPVITAAQAEGRIAGILLDEGEATQSFSLGGLDVVAQGSRALFSRLLLDAGVQPPPPAPPGPSETEGAGAIPSPADDRPYGLLIAEGDDCFLLVGRDLALDFSHPEDEIEIDHVEEGEFEDGRWVVGRVLNGDERLRLVPLDEPGATRIRVLRRPRA
jgi:hypothetical protein